MNERADTKTRILDAAEKLFGEKGFDATSLRDITTEADVNLAAVNYHFQSKESLIEAAILRGAAPVNDRRLAMLEAAGPKASVEQIVEAFVGPVLELSPAERIWRLHFTAGAMAHTVTRAPLMGDLFGGVLDVKDRQRLIAR